MIGIDNLVDFVAQCMEHPNAANQTFLVTDGEAVSTPHLVRHLARSMGRTSRLFAMPDTAVRAIAHAIGHEASVDRLWGSLAVDSSKARHLLNWIPPVTIWDGLADMAKWYASV
jgi:nucleoside-diphosphate-sugar epimerase